MEQSQRAAEPLANVSVGQLLRSLKVKPEPESVAAKENRHNAALELQFISMLNARPEFRWFQDEFIDKPFRDASSKLRSEDITQEELPRAQMTYAALRRVKVGLIEREIAHRELLDPNDEQIAILREKLSLL